MKQAKVEDIMTRKVIYAKPETKINEIARLLSKYDLHGMPVLNSQEKVVGMITETDFFTKDEANLHLPSYLQFLEKLEFQDKVTDKEKQSLKKLMDARADAIMSRKIIGVSPDTDLKKLIKIFQKKKLNLLPVINRGNKLLGIVAKADIIKLIKNNL